MLRRLDRREARCDKGNQHGDNEAREDNKRSASGHAPHTLGQLRGVHAGILRARRCCKQCRRTQTPLRKTSDAGGQSERSEAKWASIRL